MGDHRKNKKPKKQVQATSLPPPEPVNHMRQGLGCPTPASKLVICPTCGYAEWTIPVTGMGNYHESCNARMREATLVEYLQARKGRT